MKSFISDFCENCYLPPGINSSFLALIPKTSSPIQIKDYRPISLINSSIKILMKVLATRLSGHMKSLVSDTQSGFIKGRQSSESILVVKEVAHSLQKNKCKGVILKLDFEKAFDTINWDFLMDTMRAMNFDQTWCCWIRTLLESIRISILINGQPTKEFKPERGLRQGDPISPLLFNLAGEVLSSLLRTANQKEVFKGIKLSSCSEQITHLQFADDTIIFFDGTLESAMGIKRILQSFQLLSGLKINYGKSSLYSSNRFSANMKELAEVLNCSIGSWTMNYLGMPIGVSSRRRVFWEPLIKKLKSKMAKWKTDSLNQAGRLTLVKSVIDSAPIYWLNLHQMPKSICDQIERIRRDFLWGRGDNSSSESRKLHLMAWDKICKPKNYGGLGLVPMRIRNLALLGKWYYKWERERNRSWNKWIREKYGMTNHCSLSECPISSKFSDSMRSIVSVSKDDSFKGKLDKTQFIWTLKNGESIFFWEDVWISEIPLRDMFKRLYKLSLRKAITVQQFFNISHERSLKGSSFWSRSLRSWELEDVESLESIIDKAKRVEGEDFLVWAASKKSYQTCKATELLQDSGSLISWRFIWKLRVPHKIKLFLWKVHLKILPTKSFLVSREIISKDTAKCSFCNCETETENHLFFDCFKSKQLWEFIFAWWQVSSRSFNGNR